MSKVAPSPVDDNKETCGANASVPLEEKRKLEEREGSWFSCLFEEKATSSRAPMGFDPHVAVVCAHLSKIAYDDETPDLALKTLQEKTKCTEVLWRFTKEKDFMVAGFVTRDSENFYIVFRGTSDAEDATTDARLAMVPMTGGRLPYVADFPGILTEEEMNAALGADHDEKQTGLRNAYNIACVCISSRFTAEPEVWVHKGFAKAVSSTYLSLAKQLALLNTSNLPVVVTGHSLGGACAVLHAWASATPVKSVYTYGQPRIGGASFLQSYIRKGLHSKTFRFIHNLDVVPRAPSLFLGFRHPGHSLFVDNDGKANWNISPLSQLPSDVAAWTKSLSQRRIYMVDHHATDCYVADSLAVEANQRVFS